MIFSDIIHSKILSPSDIEKRRNIWGFYNYRVAAVLVSEQTVSAELVQAINLAADKADILVVAVNGSASFAEIIASLHSVSSLLLTQDAEGWMASLQPDVVLDKPGLLETPSFDGECIRI